MSVLLRFPCAIAVPIQRLTEKNGGINAFLADPSSNKLLISAILLGKFETFRPILFTAIPNFSISDTWAVRST